MHVFLGKDGGMVRVVHQETNGKRALIKNLKEDIKDLSFAYSSTEIILACVDCEGNILVYNIEDSSDSLKYPLFILLYFACLCNISLTTYIVIRSCYMYFIRTRLGQRPTSG